MAQNLVFFYALVIFLSQFLVAGMSFSHHSLFCKFIL